MRLKLIACKVLTRELSYFIALSENYVDTTFIRRSYHDTPEKLNQLLQNEIDKIEIGKDDYSHIERYGGDDFDAILLGYGLCSNAILGLSSKKYTIVVPKAHDCITLFLGSKERYKKEFDAHKGIFWYNRGWMENSVMPSEKRYQRVYADYVEKYGEDNAQYLMKMEQSWLTEYENGIFIRQTLYNDEKERKIAKKNIEFLKWNYSELDGDSSLLRDFINGDWQTDKFLIVPPGKKIVAGFDDAIIKCS